MTNATLEGYWNATFGTENYAVYFTWQSEMGWIGKYSHIEAPFVDKEDSSVTQEQRQQQQQQQQQKKKRNWIVMHQVRYNPKTCLLQWQHSDGQGVVSALVSNHLATGQWRNGDLYSFYIMHRDCNTELAYRETKTKKTPEGAVH